MVVPTTTPGVPPSLPGTVPSTVDVAPFWMPYLDTNPFQPKSASYLARQQREVLEHLRSALTEEPWDFVLIGRESFIPGIPTVARNHQIPCMSFVRGSMPQVLSGLHPDRRLAASILREAPQTERLFPVAEHLAASLKAAGYDNVRAVSNGVDTAMFSPAHRADFLLDNLAIPSTAKIVLHASNFKPVKRIDSIVSALRRVIEGDRNVYLLLVGDGPDRDAVLNQSRQLGIASKIVSPGWIANEEMAAYYSIADVAVLASESEVMPRFVLEAMACGLPFVANDIPACRELIEDGKNGLLYPSGDLDALVVSLMNLLQDADRRRRLGDAARREILRSYKIDDVVDRFEIAAQAGLAQYHALKVQ